MVPSRWLVTTFWLPRLMSMGGLSVVGFSSKLLSPVKWRDAPVSRRNVIFDDEACESPIARVAVLSSSGSEEMSVLMVDSVWSKWRGCVALTSSCLILL